MTDTPRILVVDDEAPIRNLVATVLEDEGYLVDTAPSAFDALQRIDRVRPDLILLDVMMPGMDGLELLARLRTEPKHARIPVVIMSAAYTRKDVVAGADALLPKPFDLAELLEVAAATLAPLTPLTPER